MSTESLTYSELGDWLGASPEAARSLARRLRLPRKPGNDGKMRVVVDLAEIQYTPLSTRSPGGQQADIDGWKAQAPVCCGRQPSKRFRQPSDVGLDPPCASEQCFGRLEWKMRPVPQHYLKRMFAWRQFNTTAYKCVAAAMDTARSDRSLSPADLGDRHAIRQRR